MDIMTAGRAAEQTTLPASHSQMLPGKERLLNHPRELAYKPRTNMAM